MFYTVLALLTTKQVGSSKHSGALALFDREFVKTGLFPTEMSRALRSAFDKRQTQDYREMANVDQQTAEDALDSARNFVVAVETYLHSVGFHVDSDEESK